METRVKVDIELDGQKSVKLISSLTIVQRHNWHHSFELSVPIDELEGRDKNDLTQTKAYVGKPIKISFGAASGNDTYNQFNGIITDISLYRHSGIASEIIISGYSPTILLDDGENTQSFASKSISQIVSEVTKNYPQSDLSVKTNPSPDPECEFAVQYRETNFAFLSRLADETGSWFYYDGKDVQFGKLNSPNKLSLKIATDFDNLELGLHVKPLKFTDGSYDYVNNSVINTASTSVKVSGLDSTGSDIMNKSDQLYKQDLNALPYFKVKNQSELKGFSLSKKSAAASQLVTVSGVSFNAKIKIGTKVDVASHDSEKNSANYGSFIVTDVTHNIDGLGVYYCKFEAISANLTVPPQNQNVRQPVCETQAAVVDKNDDSDGYGRIRVRFYWQKSGDNTPWIRILNHHSGKNKGFQFIPEVGDEVLVGFEQNNPSRPYVLGSLYHGKASHQDRQDKDNYIKTIRTVSGNEIKFYDKAGQEELTIQNKDGQNFISLSLDKDGLITIQSKNKIEIKAKEILIEAENKLTMKSDQVSLAGKSKVEIESEQDCSVKGMNVKFESTQNLDVKAGSQGSFKGTAGLEIDGGPNTSVSSSGMLKLDGGAGIAKISGSLVTIN